MEKEFTQIFLLVKDMKEIGKMEKEMELVELNMHTEIHIKDNFLEMKNAVKEF